MINKQEQQDCATGGDTQPGKFDCRINLMFHQGAQGKDQIIFKHDSFPFKI